MRSFAIIGVAFAASVAALTITEPGGQNKCVDITKPILVKWEIRGDPAVKDELSFNLWNAISLYPNVNDPFPIGQSPALQVKSSAGAYLLPPVSAAKAESYRNNANQGRNFQIKVPDPETYSNPFTIAAPNGGC
ncbi:hypothetical protein MYU51_008507 [Penicillium brevicompactum]|uniref:extracellular conserved serine-rich protein n=1 Tax=Penicillium brevicompactum TaxID=5074 RepID=UPI0025410930|nr:extracellular conserved serine-rich protein [Penicillium brevicompactum]KAJ5337244.1 extracellular conserved serine-rich protein [Penicillium brevicompactum]